MVTSDPNHPSSSVRQSASGNAEPEPATGQASASNSSSKSLPLVDQGRLIESAVHHEHQVTDLFHASEADLRAHRYTVLFEWETSEGEYGSGDAVELDGDQGAFWFFADPSGNLVIKVAHHAGHDDDVEYWIYADQLIDIDFRVQVVDTETGTRWRYGNY